VHARWKVIESASIAKHPDRENEDRLIFSPNQDNFTIAALVDGASLGSGSYGAKSSGALAADRVAASVTELVASAAPRDAVESIVTALRDLRNEWNIPASDLLAPSAAAAVVNGHYLWRVGDIHLAVHRASGEWEVHPADKAVDQIAAAARAALIRFRLAQGATIQSLLAEDPGPGLIAPLLQEQNAVANLDDETEALAFGTLNGKPVPDRFIETFPVTEDVDGIVLASDGYLSAAPTLNQAEEELQASLLLDPLRIGQHASTKATPPGGASFDDRTYIRIGRTDDRR